MGNATEKLVKRQQSWWRWAALFSLLVVHVDVALAQEEIGDCFGDIEFFLVDELAIFQAAKDGCAGRGATLARIASIQEHTFVRNFLSGEGISEIIWIGKLFFWAFGKHWEVICCFRLGRC